MLKSRSADITHIETVVWKIDPIISLPGWALAFKEGGGEGGELSSFEAKEDT